MWLKAALNGVPQAFDDCMEAARGALCRQLNISNTEVVFSPSGTDAQLQALFLVKALLGTPLVTLIAGADQTGSGTAHTARGHHFSDCTSLGTLVQKAAPIEDAAVQALRGGADLLLICHSEDPIERAYEAVARERDRDRRFSAKVRQSAARVARLKKKFARSLSANTRPTHARVERLSRALWEFGERVRMGTLDREERP